MIVYCSGSQPDSACGPLTVFGHFLWTPPQFCQKREFQFQCETSAKYNYILFLTWSQRSKRYVSSRNTMILLRQYNDETQTHSFTQTDRHTHTHTQSVTHPLTQISISMRDLLFAFCDQFWYVWFGLRTCESHITTHFKSISLLWLQIEHHWKPCFTQVRRRKREKHLRCLVAKTWIGVLLL